MAARQTVQQMGWGTLLLRGTFIDVEKEDSAEVGSALRRARSDPGLRSECSDRESAFAGEVAYVQGLACSFATLWGQKTRGVVKGHRRQHSGSGISEDATSVGSAESFLTISDTRSFSDKSTLLTPNCTPTSGQTSPVAISGLPGAPAQTSVDSRVSEAAAAELALTMPGKLPKGMSNRELKDRIYARTRKISKKLQSRQQFRGVLAAVEEFQEQDEVGEPLRSLDEVRTEKITQVVANQVVAQMLLEARMVDQVCQTPPEEEDEEVIAPARDLNASRAEQSQHEGSDHLASETQIQTSEAPRLASVGHPSLCSRPCLYFPLGQCSNGDACSFCHLPHPKRPTHLDKRNRDMLRTMPLRQSVVLLLPVLKQRVLEFDSSADTLSLFAALVEACGVAAEMPGGVLQQQSPLPKQHRMLVATLRSMSLRSLLTTAGRACTQSQPEIQALFENLLRHLRGLASAEFALPASPRGSGSIESGC